MKNQTFFKDIHFYALLKGTVEYGKIHNGG